MEKSILKLLKSKGESLTLVRTTTGAYDPATSSATETSTNYTIQAAIVQYKINEVDGTLVQRGDRKAIIAASGLDVVPRNDDKISGLGDAVRVVSTHRIRNNGKDVAFICQVRE